MVYHLKNYETVLRVAQGATLAKCRSVSRSLVERT